MKKMLAVTLALLLLAGTLCGCAAGEKGTEGSKRLTIVCSVFPFYDWMRELTAGNGDIELILITDNGVDMHSYQATTGDIVDITYCDMLVYGGGMSDEWVDEVVDSSGRDMVVADLLDMLGDRALCAAPHDHEQGEHDHEHSHDAKDEHLWLSPVNAMLLCDGLCEMLCELDSENSDLYRANAENYIQKLEKLDEGYRTAAETATAPALVFADRFPFRYLAHDYQIDYHAAFDGCEAETEASFDTITELSSVLNRLKLDCVLIIEGSEDRLARTIISDAGQEDRVILSLDSMQSISIRDIWAGAAYLSIMESNLSVLEQALGCQ